MLSNNDSISRLIDEAAESPSTIGNVWALQTWLEDRTCRETLVTLSSTMRAKFPGILFS